MWLFKVIYRTLVDEGLTPPLGCSRCILQPESTRAIIDREKVTTSQFLAKSKKSKFSFFKTSCSYKIEEASLIELFMHSCVVVKLDGFIPLPIALTNSKTNYTRTGFQPGSSSPLPMTLCAVVIALPHVAQSARGSRIHRLYLYRGVRHRPMSVIDMKLNNLMARFQWCCSFW